MHTLYRALLLLLVVLLARDPLQAVTPEDSSGRNLLGIYLSVEDSNTGSLPDLGRLTSVGIGVVELELPTTSNLLFRVEKSDLLVLARQQRRFITSVDIQRTDSLYLSEDQEWIARLSDRLGSRFIAYAPFTYPNDLTPAGVVALDNYAGKIILPEGSLRLYYLSANSAQDPYEPHEYTFRSLRHGLSNQVVGNSTVFHLTAEGADHPTLDRFYQLLEYSLQMDESIILLPREWLTEQLERYEWFDDVLKSYTNEGKLLRLYPEAAGSTPAVNWDITLLLLLFGVVLLHIRFNPVYREALFRYFLSHRYFLEQIVEYRIRQVSISLLLFLQHALLTGIALHLWFHAVLSPLAKEMLYEQLGLLSLFGEGPLSLIVTGMTIAILYQAVSSLWLHLTSRKYRFRQLLAIYTWPLHLNLLNVLLMTAFYHGGASEGKISTLLILFMVIWVLGFVMSAFDIAGRIQRFRIIYLIGTAGIYLILHLVILVLALYYPPVAEILDMALQIP